MIGAWGNKACEDVEPTPFSEQSGALAQTASSCSRKQRLAYHLTEKRAGRNERRPQAQLSKKSVYDEFPPSREILSWYSRGKDKEPECRDPYTLPIRPQ
jgi:hypothetical protein